MHNKRIICVGLSLIMTAAAALGCGASTAATTSSEPAAAETAAEASEETAEASDAAGEQAEAPADAAERQAEAPAAAEGQAEAAGEQAEAPADAASENAAADVAAAEEISPDDISVTWEDSHVYGSLTLGKYDTITTYGVKEYEQVPFIMVSDYMNFLLEGKQKTVIEDGVMKISVNGAEVVIDPAADTITIDNTAKFRSSGFVDGAIVDFTEFNAVTPSAKNESTQTKVVPLTVSLKDYHMPVIAYEDDILMPFLALQNVFGSIRTNNVLAYNGKDYFNVFEAENFAMDEGNEAAKESPYYKAIYSGPFSEVTQTSQAFADYGYYSTCLLLDLSFGHKQEKNITTFDEYFTRLNAKKSMCSTDPSSAAMAEAVLFFYLFDSGHDALMSFDTTVFGKMEANQEMVGDLADDIKKSEEGEQLFKDAQEEVQDTEAPADDPMADVLVGALIEKGFNIPEMAPLLAWTSLIGRMKPEDYGKNRLDFADDTAVIYFEGFADDSTKRSPSYYLDPIKEEDSETSSFAFFYNCFEEIKQHDEVKNVVINLSNNGGGAATGLVSILGFLSEDGEAKMTLRDLMAGNYKEECYHVDTNLDGIADDRDGYGGQYEFYIMCSGSSYSCANALPYFAQQAGLAKIIGTNPGGGDCVVATFVDAYGRVGVYSGFLKLGKEDANGFVSDEKATVVDLNMMPSLLDATSVPWYDVQGITDAVHRYQNGETEIHYVDTDEVVSSFLTEIFSQMAEGSTADAAE